MGFDDCRGQEVKGSKGFLQGECGSALFPIVHLTRLDAQPRSIHSLLVYLAHPDCNRPCFSTNSDHHHPVIHSPILSRYYTGSRLRDDGPLHMLSPRTRLVISSWTGLASSRNSAPST